jgi:CRP-like cAMP-binding protein
MSDILLKAFETSAPPDTLEALATSEVFGALPRLFTEELGARSTVRHVRRGERLWEPGSPSDALALVASGRIKCWNRGHEGRQWVNAIVRAGGVCGLHACVDGGPHTCIAEPLERSRVVLVPAVTVRAVIDRSPAFAGKVSRVLARDLRNVLASCEDVTLRTPMERLARFLVREAEKTGIAELHETQTQLAAQLGTVREVIGRGLRSLEARGVIARTGKVVRVLRPRDLELVARGG